jgi:uncharacterized protein (TIGR02145 family)
MNRKHPFSWVIPFIAFSMMHFMLSAQAPAELDSKMKPGTSNDMRIEELKVRWKKAALENCAGVPCVTTSFTCGTSTISDIDGNSYNTVAIGTQCWTKENLTVSKYNDGTVIPLDQSGGTAGNGTPTETWSAFNSGAKTVFAHNPTYLNELGYLYNWHAAVDNRGICPAGWKVPTKLEWQTLETFLSIGGDAGLKMMVTTRPYGWTTSSKTNSSGFTALSSGYRLGTSGGLSGAFYRADVPGATPTIFYARWWSIDSASLTSKDVVILEDQMNSGFYLTQNPPNLGASIRCLKN